MNLSTQCLIVIYIGYWSAIDSLQQDVESISKFDYEGASTPMGPNDSRSELIFLDDTVYEGYISFQLTFMFKGVLVITQGCTG